jgi:membrane protein involved in colicin uptake
VLTLYNEETDKPLAAADMAIALTSVTASKGFEDRLQKHLVPAVERFLVNEVGQWAVAEEAKRAEKEQRAAEKAAEKAAAKAAKAAAKKKAKDEPTEDTIPAEPVTDTIQ